MIVRLIDERRGNAVNCKAHCGRGRLLLIMPVAVWVSGWSWQPGHNVWWLKSLYWITETVTQPWGIITHVVLCAWFLWCLRFRLKAAVMLFAILLRQF